MLCSAVCQLVHSRLPAQFMMARGAPVSGKASGWLLHELTGVLKDGSDHDRSARNGIAILAALFGSRGDDSR